MKQTYTITQAVVLICKIAKIDERLINSIMYEDGSGHRFVYEVNGVAKYIDINKHIIIK